MLAVPWLLRCSCTVAEWVSCFNRRRFEVAVVGLQDGFRRSSCCAGDVFSSFMFAYAPSPPALISASAPEKQRYPSPHSRTYTASKKIGSYCIMFGLL